MIQRTLTLLFLMFSLIGATPAISQVKRIALISQDYAIVDDNPVTARGYYLTIGAAVASGATTIEVRDGVYPESVTLNRPLTLLCRDGATLINDGTGVSIVIAAQGVTIKDCEIEGNHDGNPDIGDFWNGTGIHDLAGHSHIDGLKTRNLRGFSYINPTAAADNVILENFNIQNVATVRDEHKCVQYAILFMGESEGHVVRNGRVSGASKAVGLWYGVNHTTVQGNTFTDNYGWVGANCDVPRSAIEDYGLGRGNTGNRYLDNAIDGTNGNGFELADVLFDTLVSRNTTRNTYNGAFGVWGSGMNRGQNVTIAGNTFYGMGLGVDKTNRFAGSGAIEGNYFIDYVENNIGTIHIPSQSLDGQTIRNNHFIRNGRVLRATKSGGAFVGNVIEDGQYLSDHLYFDVDVEEFLIADNTMYGVAERAINAVNAEGLTVRNNTLEGQVWAGTGAWIEGNTVYGDGWIAIMLFSNSTAINNRAYSDGIPILIDHNQEYILIERNRIARLDGSANTNLPTCSGTNTCSGNWTVGQVPPP